MRKRLSLILMVFLVIGILSGLGCSTATTVSAPPGVQQTAGTTATQPGQSYSELSSEQLKSEIDSNKVLFILDVREKEEYAEGHLANSTLIPIGEIEARINELPKDKDIIVVCATGARSSAAANYLTQQGFPRIFNLNGGLTSWPYELLK